MLEEQVGREIGHKYQEDNHCGEVQRSGAPGAVEKGIGVNEVDIRLGSGGEP
jgi:hypothetical protein